MSAHHEHDPDLVECSECGRQFDLALQHYYGPVPVVQERVAGRFTPLCCVLVPVYALTGCKYGNQRRPRC